MKKVLFLALVFPLFAVAQKKADLDKINREITAQRKNAAEISRQADRARAEVNATQKKLVENARRLSSIEADIAKNDRELAMLTARRKTLESQAQSAMKNLVDIYAAFQRIAHAPAGYMTFDSANIDDMFATSVMMRSVVATLVAARQKYSFDIAEISEVQAQIERTRGRLAGLNKNAAGERASIQKLITQKRNASAALDARQKQTKAQIDKLIKESRTIEEFLKREAALRAQRTAAAAKPSRVFTGKIDLPVAGRIIYHFDDMMKDKVRSKGIYMSVADGAQVVSPTDAEVVFSGAFYGYRSLAILHSDDDFYVIIGGMKNSFIAEGQRLLAGEPIGEAGRDNMYIEIREGERIINPTKYFRLRNE
ncbi:MAG: peptidoglycan DD-metalloendopeptidase family protein [Alphaproteobacteria bacterium]|nr:peptidoglycan DD-metalloendopeptidase family protein [Alphaproteobacteria bacterium]